MINNEYRKWIDPWTFYTMIWTLMIWDFLCRQILFDINCAVFHFNFNQSINKELMEWSYWLRINGKYFNSFNFCEKFKNKLQVVYSVWRGGVGGYWKKYFSNDHRSGSLSMCSQIFFFLFDAAVCVSVSVIWNYWHTQTHKYTDTHKCTNTTLR